jgi:small subunit ribosomal protein S3
LTTLRADIDYAVEEANTTYGKIGVKVWINRGEIFGKGLDNQVVPTKQERPMRGDSRGPRRPRNDRAPAAAPTIDVATPSTGGTK